MSEEDRALMQSVVTELRLTRADMALLRHELQRVASEHEGLRKRVDLVEARCPEACGE